MISHDCSRFLWLVETSPSETVPYSCLFLRLWHWSTLHGPRPRCLWRFYFLLHVFVTGCSFFYVVVSTFCVLFLLVIVVLLTFPIYFCPLLGAESLEEYSLIWSMFRTSFVTMHFWTVCRTVEWLLMERRVSRYRTSSLEFRSRVLSVLLLVA